MQAYTFVETLLKTEVNKIKGLGILRPAIVVVFDNCFYNKCGLVIVVGSFLLYRLKMLKHYSTSTLFLNALECEHVLRDKNPQLFDVLEGTPQIRF